MFKKISRLGLELQPILNLPTLLKGKPQLIEAMLLLLGRKLQQVLENVKQFTGAWVVRLVLLLRVHELTSALYLRF